jgi:sirohydrochlorin cobaltochelatase
MAHGSHGGNPLWEKTVRDMVKQAQLPYPTRIFFGMAHTRDEVEQLQEAVTLLEDKGAKTIIVIPILVSSYSEVFRQWRYLLGIDVQPGFNTAFFPIRKHAEIQFAEPFNDDPLVSLILLDRAREISQNPAQETVFLIAHGPNDESDNLKWLSMMRKHCIAIKERGGFKMVDGLTMRDDAPTEVRSAAIDLMRTRIENVSKEGGRALVIPLLVAQGGIENKIGIALKGLDYTLNGKTLLPDNRIPQWIRSKVP